MRVNDKGFIYHKIGGSGINYEISDEVAKGGDATVRYYGWLANGGAWVIMQEDLDAGSYRYIAGKTDYSTNWTNRESLSYMLFSGVG